MIWQLQEAKQRFSDLVRRAQDEGPQVVTRHGDRAVVVISADDYDRLTHRRGDLAEFLLEGPDFDALDLERSGEPPREVAL
ncbi:MAG: type II toxin-antitoxin system Phd/YefM family antitoxin [Actinomycetota bacterium]|jgi:prevent-host-death family protein|nr:type II toxin-antitoxin system Phd/YefM family antitoxin [Euzebyaceae bacterium]MDQ3430952.1 type II toxin-antitoxin system Phd/YefM family antitoxin [Actinomycetota bacterium]